MFAPNDLDYSEPRPSANWINGEWAAGESEKPSESHSPCGRYHLLQGQAASDLQVASAFSAARAAFPAWRRLTLENRIEIVQRYRDLVRENADSLAQCIAQETGKPLWETRGEANAVVGKVDLSIQAIQERRWTTAETGLPVQAVTRFQPHGVLGVLGPFNFPAHLPNGHIVPALLAGNCVVFKPSEWTPAVGQWMTSIWAQAGLPAGVLNLVQGGRETGAALIQDPQLDGLLFTGSSNAGTFFHKHFAAHPEKILALEMGGNNPLVVSHVEALDAAVYQILLSAFLTSGQRCTCARRLIVVEDTQTDALIELLTRRTRGIRVGWFDDEQEPFMGPVISHEAGVSLLQGWQTLLAHGGRPILEPTVQRDCPALLTPGIIEMPEAKTYEDREWFGPLLQVFRVPNLDSAIQLANETRYGLSAGLLSDRPEQWQQFIGEIRAGVVNWNRQTTGASGKLPFGGCGLSGNHRPSAYYAADYCSFPVASMESKVVELPKEKMTGLAWE